MNVEIVDDYPALSAAVAQRVIDTVSRKPNALICIAGGDTPLGVFDVLVRASEEGKVDFSHAAFVGLDEWLGLGKADKGSCREMVWGHFFSRLTLRDEQICFFDGLTTDPAQECRRVDSFISDHGGIDTIVLGIGMNGHIGFNEPGAAIDTQCHVVDLDDVTQSVSVKSTWETSCPSGSRNHRPRTATTLPTPCTPVPTCPTIWPVTKGVVPAPVPPPPVPPVPPPPVPPPVPPVPPPPVPPPVPPVPPPPVPPPVPPAFQPHSDISDSHHGYP